MKFEFITSFSSTVKALVDEEKDKYLALASLVDVGNFVPNVDTEANIDLLPVAFNACVVNRVNRNGDVIDSETAVAMAKNFVNKPINLEHKRDRVVGTILSVGYSEFGTDKQLTEEEVKALARDLPNINKAIEGKEVRKVIVVPNKIINFVI